MPNLSLPVTYVKHRGFFEFDQVVRDLQGWFLSNGYTLQMDTLRKKPGVVGSNYTLKIKSDKRITGFVKFHFQIMTKIYNLRGVELIKDGKKIKTQEGEAQFQITPKIELDWQKKFEGKFLEKILKFFIEHIYKYVIGDHWDDMALEHSVKIAKTIQSSLGQEVV